jgi:hypothetical protein
MCTLYTVYSAQREGAYIVGLVFLFTSLLVKIPLSRESSPIINVNTGIWSMDLRLYIERLPSPPPPPLAAKV